MDQCFVGRTARYGFTHPRDRHRPAVAYDARRTGIPRALPRHHSVLTGGLLGLPVVAAIAPFFYLVLLDVHHPRGHPNPRRSPPALLEAGLYARPRVVSLPAPGSPKPSLDVETRLGAPPAVARYSRRSSLDRTRPLVAFFLRFVMGNYRCDFLCVAVHDGPVAQAGADHLGDFP